MCTRRLIVPAVLVGLAACGPVASTSVIIDASAELAAASTAQAKKHAPFEYTAAEVYLHKAREEQSYADFELAIDYGNKSWACARVARTMAERATQEKMGTAGLGRRKMKAVCRPGPKRDVLDAHLEPAAQGKPIVPRGPDGEPADPEAAPVVVKPKPVAKPVAPKPVAKPKPRPTEKPKVPPALPDDSLPDGDEDDLPPGDELPEGDPEVDE